LDKRKKIQGEATGKAIYQLGKLAPTNKEISRKRFESLEGSLSEDIREEIGEAETGRNQQSCTLQPRDRGKKGRSSAASGGGGKGQNAKREGGYWQY